MSEESDATESRLPWVLFLLSCGALLFTYGVLVGTLHWFPYSLFDKAKEGFDNLQQRAAAKMPLEEMAALGTLPFYYQKVDDRPPMQASELDKKQLTLVTHMERERINSAALINGEGDEVHRWNLDWFHLWPDAVHIPERFVPKSKPGALIHGSVLLEDRKLVFVFEHLGLMCVDREGKLLWRLPYRVHHSLHLAASGNLWASGHIHHPSPTSEQPWRSAPFDEYTVVEISPQGELLNEWSIDQVLIDNGYAGLLRMPTGDQDINYPVQDDLLHLNDAEPFPEHFEEGFFKHGDVMVSLRNINTVMVFNRDTQRIRYINTGSFDAQHDPDFIDGNRFSVYDNNRLMGMRGLDNLSSRIVIVDARNDSMEVYFEGSPELPFYSMFAGKHQWLPNGHLLIAESCGGRAIELNRDKEIVWEYRHHVGENITGLLTEAARLTDDGRTALPHSPLLPPSP